MSMHICLYQIPPEDTPEIIMVFLGEWNWVAERQG